MSVMFLDVDEEQDVRWKLLLTMKRFKLCDCARSETINRQYWIDVTSKDEYVE